MANDNNNLLVVKNLKKYFPIRRGVFQRHVGDVKAVDDVSFTIKKGETLGLVGESGCGKSTTGKTILQLDRATAGEVFFDGQNLTQMKGETLRQMRRQMQIIFQDPFASLNPRMTVGEIVGEPLDVHGVAKGEAKTQRVAELLSIVGLDPTFVTRFPHEFSGGQRQRIGVARALALNPSFIVCDEPIAALDVSIQAQVVNLLEDLQQQFGLTYLFIAHDLSMVRHISDRVAVMYLGRIVEISEWTTIYDDPRHPYSQALLSAIPIPDPAIEAKRQRIVLEGDVPSAANVPVGCRFNTRCPLRQERCVREDPQLREIAPGHMVACHYAELNSGAVPLQERVQLAGKAA
jgi:oligopeptide transport system ATP-binding protein